MTDTEKYARIFRAAADGIIIGTNLKTYAPNCTYYSSSVLENYGVSREGAIMYMAYSGIANMFEKMLEAEHSTITV